MDENGEQFLAWLTYLGLTQLGLAYLYPPLLVSGHPGNRPFWYLVILVSGHFGILPLWYPAILVTGQFGIRPFV